jgi:2-dehydropantoate 2-reductase
MKHIVIAGAGAIGNFLGVQLHKAGFIVSFLGSARVVNVVNQNGLILEYPDKKSTATSKDHFLPGDLHFTTDADCCEQADLVILTAKCLVTKTLLEQINPHIHTNTTLLTLQNGISNVAILETSFPNNPVRGGMVTFNVIERTVTKKAPAIFRLTTRGDIYLRKSTPSLLSIFQKGSCAAKELEDINSFLWSKLLLNLINPLNALSGLPLKQNLADRAFRLRWAACMREGLAVLKAAKIKPAKVTPLSPQMLPFMLSLPNSIYLAVARNMTDMDPTAISSMAQDLAKGKQTEIDYLSGEIIRLGKRVGVATPENEKVYAAVKLFL